MLRSRPVHIILLLICFTGCIEPFQPDIEEQSGVLVIDGRITDIPGMQTVTISRSVTYHHPEFKPVSGCVVWVEDGEGEGIYYNEASGGVYRADPPQGIVETGKAFKIKVSTPDGKTYESEYDTLLPCADLKDLYYQEEVQGTSDPDVNFYGVRFYADVEGGETASSYFLWNFEETWEYLSEYPIQYILYADRFEDHTPELHGYKICYLTELLSEFRVGSTSMLERNELRGEPLYFVSNQTPRLRNTYSLLVIQHSLSGGAYEYWERMGARESETGGLFETQPSATRGNIFSVNDPEEKVLGYFFASQVKQKRVTISEQFQFPIAEFDCPLDTVRSLEYFDADYPILFFSLSIFGRGPPYGYSLRECFDCRYRGGVTTRPEFLDE